MGESQNISALAERISLDLFRFFGWSLIGETNFNFPCEDEIAHKKEASHHHPCDCIFSYRDPYSGKTQYLLTDLKSYASKTLEKKDLQGSLRELAKSIACAIKSVDHFHTFLNTNEPYEIHGLLFIHNHDGQFDDNFKKKLIEHSQNDIPLPRNTRIFVVGPEEIAFLSDVINDLKITYGEDNVHSSITFFHPNQVGTLPKRRIPLKVRWHSAMIESLLSPFLVVQSNTSSPTDTKNTIYYKNHGETRREFELLIDYCFRYNLLDDNSSVTIKSSVFDETFEREFDAAKESFSRLFFASEEMHRKLDQKVSVKRMPRTEIRYSEHDIGMSRRNEFRRTLK